MGTLFCIEIFKQIKPVRMLEVGAGCTTFFDNNSSAEYEYWMVDDGEFYKKDAFDASMQKRKNTRFVNALLGLYNPELPDKYFDLIFSVSVLEHVPDNMRRDVYKDMFRVLRPGGFIAHSIDLSGLVGGYQEYMHIKKAGFKLPFYPDLSISVRHGAGRATLFEPIDLVYRFYFGIDCDDMWTNFKSIKGHSPTILVFAQKPVTS